MLGEKANRFKAPYLYGKHGRICGGYKCEGERALPGEICVSPTGQDGSSSALRDRQKSAEGIVGPSTGLKARTYVAARRPSFR